MKKKAVVILCILCSTAYVVAATNMGASDIVIDAGRKKSVQLPHKTHQSVIEDCSVCHSTFPKEKNSIRSMIDSGKLGPRSVMAICRGCHMKMARTDKKTGPTSCGVCHSG